MLRKLARTKLHGILDLSQDDPDYEKYMCNHTGVTNKEITKRIKTKKNKKTGITTSNTGANAPPPLGRIPSYKSMMESITGQKLECLIDKKEGTKKCHAVKVADLATEEGT